MIRIGVICPSEIAYRRFLPALKTEANSQLYEYIGVAYASPEEWFGSLNNITDEQIKSQKATELAKAAEFEKQYGGKIFCGYNSLINSDEIDAIYIPLPPALHYQWAKRALEAGKHVMVEKPSTTSLSETKELIELAIKNNLAIHENYMFVFHDQIKTINDIVAEGNAIGKPRLYRITFGFPRRSLNDFRYNKKLGGGALLDAGGYTIRYATELLGESAILITANVNYDSDFEVEIFGSATMVNNSGLTAQLAFGMDNDYRCDLEIWGTKGTLTSGRILTAPAGFVPKYELKQNQKIHEYFLPADDAFAKSLQRFASCIHNKNVREDNFAIIERQSSLVQQFMNMTNL